MSDNILESLANAVEEFEHNIDEYIRVELAKYPTDILELLYDQLRAGKAADGSDLRPYYSEDPWFTGSDKAYNYAKWKKRLNPDPRRHWDVPDLFIDGTFYGEIGLRLDYSALVFYEATAYAREIMAKYGVENFDLGEIACMELGAKILPALQNRLETILKI